MQKAKARKKLHDDKPPLPLESGVVISYLEDLGISDKTLFKVIGILQASLRKEGELLNRLEGAYDLYHRQLDLAKPESGPGSFDDASVTLRRILEIRSELEFEKQNVWILVAKESGRPELAQGLRGVPRHIAEKKILVDPSIRETTLKYLRRQVAKTAVGLARLRRERGLTLDQVAKATRSLFPFTTEAHIAAPHLHKAENGRTLLSPLKLMALSRVYDIPFDVFISGLGLPDLMPRMREMARDLVMGAFGSLDEAKKDRDVTLQVQLGQLKDELHQVRVEKEALLRENESLKRQIKFLEAEVKTLRSTGK